MFTSPVTETGVSELLLWDGGKLFQRRESVELKLSNVSHVSSQGGHVIHHFRDSSDVVIRRAQKLNQTLERVLPEDSGAA